MIDVENFLYDAVAAEMPQKVYCSSGFQREIDAFPHFTLTVENNSVYENEITSGGIENAIQIAIEINAYSNNVGTRRSECKEIISIADNVLNKIGLIRVSCKPTPNISDMTIYRITARYRAVVDKKLIFYRR